MKRIAIISVVIYTLLGFGLFSIPSRIVNISDGTMDVDCGLPLRWLTLHQHLNDGRQPISSRWWKTDNTVFKLSGLSVDLTAAGLIGFILTVWTVRILKGYNRWNVTRDAKDAGFPLRRDCDH